jgi:mannose-6-phosphate isomerase-like protein (cupin superfamily)
MQVRRVVTGHDANGKAVVASDTYVDGLSPAMTPGTEFHNLWGADAAPHFPDDGRQPEHHSYFPPVGGFRFGMFSVPPGHRVDTEPPADLEAAFAEFEATLPGLASYMEPDAPGMHTTDTIDFEVVLSGELTLELDNGVEKVMKPGDTIVQSGTRHRWHNRGTEPAVFVSVVIGAHRK